ncbi:accessory Sec system protein Asp1 [Periweissella fabaria]|uniref:Accessory Sec system protein Asp1 n=1 Tax=Periweissella fabaria TaxID=546157 RepID=A0ABN8BEZ4_9LACO|nr:accessory Sec system protein Asp1 [Periweissella fabaria]MCM0597198.1 accessory Sec system protein Asp1 [Periweissella fabaria]CAH0416297.1 Accessory Sec system protein Asp1 [Periweissella fabaria]
MLRLMTTWKWDAVDINFDYLVNLANMFTNNDEQFELISTNFTPVLRYQLLSQDLSSSKVWSLYDALQGITIKDGQPITFNDIPLPDDADIIYTPFGINVYYNKQIYARIIPYNDNIICKVVYFVAGQQDVIDYYDDRGFLSRRDLLGTPHTNEQHFYFSQDGQLVLSEKQGGDTPHQVTIYPLFYQRFKHHEYQNLQAVLVEIFENYANKTAEPFVLTVDNLHPSEFTQRISLRYPVVAYLEQTLINKLSTELVDENMAGLLTAAKAIVIPENEGKQVLTDFIKEQRIPINLKKIKVIAPYSVNLDLGISNILVETNIVINAIQKSAADAIKIIKTVTELIVKDTDLNLIMVVENSVDTVLMMATVKEYLMQKLAIDDGNPDLELIEQYVLAKKANEPNPVLLKEIRLLEKKDPSRYNNMITLVQMLHNIKFEKQLNRAKWHQLILKARVYADLNDNPDLYPVIQTIETGIPLLVAKKIEFLHQQHNGEIIQTLKQLAHYLAIYIYQLNVWNDTLVYDVQLGNAYGDAELTAKWKEVGDGR